MTWYWIGFSLLVLTLLALDLGVFHKEAHEVKVKEALGWSAFWISLGVAFSGFIYLAYSHHWQGIGLVGTDLMAVTASNPEGHLDGGAAALKYLTGYLIEKSLSVDNIFVISLVFGSTRVPARYRHRVLFWGILGALVMRGVMIGVGVELIRRFAWMTYVFGGVLILTALKMLLMKDEGADPSTSAAVRWTRKLIPVTSHFHGEHFFVRAGSHASHEAAVPGGHVERDAAVEHMKKGAWMATPLFVALVIVEFTDVVFAVDSIPAIFAITTDPFLVFTSNVFAILGLRSLYFALEGMIDSFRFLKVSLAAILLLVGVKMLTHSWLKQLLGEHFNLWVLAIIALILAAGVAASKLWPEKKDEPGS